jgi:hypothetical protein
MEWLAVGLFALGMLIWSVLFLLKKLLRFRPIAIKLQEQAALIAEANAKAPDIAKLASALNEDPVVHVARRLELQRAARKRKADRERRLRSRVF